jgi:hypothetical protein
MKDDFFQNFFKIKKAMSGNPYWKQSLERSGFLLKKQEGDSGKDKREEEELKKFKLPALAPVGESTIKNWQGRRQIALEEEAAIAGNLFILRAAASQFLAREILCLPQDPFSKGAQDEESGTVPPLTTTPEKKNEMRRRRKLYRPYLPDRTFSKKTKMRRGRELLFHYCLDRTLTVDEVVLLQRLSPEMASLSAQSVLRATRWAEENGEVLFAEYSPPPQLVTVHLNKCTRACYLYLPCSLYEEVHRRCFVVGPVHSFQVTFNGTTNDASIHLVEELHSCFPTFGPRGSFRRWLRSTSVQSEPPPQLWIEIPMAPSGRVYVNDSLLSDPLFHNNVFCNLGPRLEIDVRIQDLRIVSVTRWCSRRYRYDDDEAEKMLIGRPLSELLDKDELARFDFNTYRNYQKEWVMRGTSSTTGPAFGSYPTTTRLGPAVAAGTAGPGGTTSMAGPRSSSSSSSSSPSSSSAVSLPSSKRQAKKEKKMFYDRTRRR